MSREKALERLGCQPLLRRRTLVKNAATTLLQIERANIVLLHNPENHLFQRLHTLRLLTHLLLESGRLLIELAPRLDNRGQVLQLLRLRNLRGHLHRVSPRLGGASRSRLVF